MMPKTIHFRVSNGVVCICPIIIVNEIRLFMLDQHANELYQLRKMNYKPDIIGVDNIDDV